MKSDIFIDIKSVCKGIRAMKRESKKASWSLKWMPKRFWLHAWTPIWHDGNGPYLTCGFYFVAVYRGY